MDIITGAALGSSAGMRVFLPLFLFSLAANGYLPLGLGVDELPSSLAWLGTPYAIAGTAALYGIERLAYFVPGFDNITDVVEAVLAPIAGTIMSTAVIAQPGAAESVHALIPLASISSAGAAEAGVGAWIAGFIIGGIPALVIHGAIALVRAALNLMTCCLGTVASVFEDIGAVVIFILAAVLAILAIVLLAGLMAWLIVLWTRRRRRPQAA